MNQLTVSRNDFSGIKSPLIGCVYAQQKKYPNRWRLGQSGNRKGRPKTNISVQLVARERMPEAMTVLIDIALSEKATLNTRMRAAAALLNIAWGSRRTFAAPYSGPVKMRIQEYIDQMQASAWGLSDRGTSLYCTMKKKQREHEATSCTELEGI